jgi:uncharacterized protein YkwD
MRSFPGPESPGPPKDAQGTYCGVGSHLSGTLNTGLRPVPRTFPGKLSRYRAWCVKSHPGLRSRLATLTTCKEERTMITTLALCATSILWSAPPAQATQTAQAQTETQKEAKPPADRLELHPIEEQIIQLTNFERAKYRLPPLEADPELMKSARQHATWMTVNQRMVHTNRPVAENIAMGQPTGQDAMNSWMNSSGHRANILNGGHRRIGVAAYRSVSGAVYWCQQFLR